MKITFLGTGAADWVRTLHRDVPGFRRNASALIDDCLLIDPGPDVPDALGAFGKQAKNIRYVINTHSHSDHYCQSTLSALPEASFVPMTSGQVQTLGRYTVRAVSANHSTCKQAVHFIISDGEKSIFYGLDGAWLLYDEVVAIQENPVDLAVLDATVGNVPGDYRIFEHNNLDMVIQMKQSLQQYVKRFCISHMAKTLHDSHEVLAQAMSEQGIEVAFDGYETEV